jgi:hypothetical protein
MNVFQFPLGYWRLEILVDTAEDVPDGDSLRRLSDVDRSPYPLSKTIMDGDVNYVSGGICSQFVKLRLKAEGSLGCIPLSFAGIMYYVPHKLRTFGISGVWYEARRELNWGRGYVMDIS